LASAGERDDAIKKDLFMSLFHDSLRAFAAGVAVCCVAYAATALPSETTASIADHTFKPETLTVPVGTTVAWKNDDDTVHTVVARDGTFRSQALDTEDKFSFTFDKAGTFEYFCSLHPYMKARVVVAP
jgi:plastocyanin